MQTVTWTKLDQSSRKSGIMVLMLVAHSLLASVPFVTTTRTSWLTSAYIHTVEKDTRNTSAGIFLRPRRPQFHALVTRPCAASQSRWTMFSSPNISRLCMDVPSPNVTRDLKRPSKILQMSQMTMNPPKRSPSWQRSNASFYCCACIMHHGQMANLTSMTRFPNKHTIKHQH